MPKTWKYGESSFFDDDILSIKCFMKPRKKKINSTAPSKIVATAHLKSFKIVANLMTKLTWV